MCRAGHTVVFDMGTDGEDRSHAVHKTTGERTEFVLRNRVWELDVEVVPHQQAEKIATKIIEQRREADTTAPEKAMRALNPFGGQVTQP